MVETLVTMVVMSVVTAIFTTGIVQIYSTSNINESVTTATQQLHSAFLRLDRTIRYAVGISKPAKLAGNSNWYVEYKTTTAGVDTCSQLRVVAASGQLQTRSQVTGSPASGWTVLASYLTSTVSLQRQDASASGKPYQQLTVSLTVKAGGGTTSRTTSSTFTYTALNTKPEDPTDPTTNTDAICASLART
jgi:hypothetical protein